MLGPLYASQALQNYKDTIWGRSKFAKMIGTTQRDWAYSMTHDRRMERREAAGARWNKRRRYFKKAEKLKAIFASALKST